jgi:hypothetical protein
LSNKFKSWILAILSVGMLLLAAIVPPIPQPPSYHHFADSRECFGIPNCFNVISNLPFLFVGVAGLLFLLTPPGSRAAKAITLPSERWPFVILFLNVALVCFGSAYYHLAPDSDRLLWDRLPIAIGIMALLAATLNDRISPEAGTRLLPVLIAIGAGTVLNWYWSEQRGEGNLNFYVVVQFYSLLAIVLLGVFFRSRYTRGGDIYAALGLYALGKVAEFTDRPIYALGHAISGHSVKHLLAACAICCILRMLRKREPLQGTMEEPAARSSGLP